MLKNFIALFLATVIVASELVTPVQAIGFDLKYYSGNDISFFDPTCNSEEVVGSVQLAGNSNTEKILNFFMRKGLTLAQSAGIVGNMMQESGLNPAIRQGGKIVDDTYVLENGVGFGLVQWTFTGRQKPLQDHMKAMGVGVTDLGGQLEYVWVELSGTYSHTLRALKETTDPVAAAVVVHGPPSPGYEASADSPEKVRTVRGGNAKKVYDEHKDAPALAEKNDQQPASKSSGCDDGGADFAGGDLSATLMAYAHPQYNATRTDQQPAYTAAVSKAKSEGRYVGGSGGGVQGNDCGGFVTTLIYDSGFDKAYNKNAKGGNTTHQEEWLKSNWKPISATDAGDRKAGDVAINGEHTYIYVGEVAGFDEKIASASLGGPPRAPMAGKEGITDSSFRWYRKR